MYQKMKKCIRALLVSFHPLISIASNLIPSERGFDFCIATAVKFHVVHRTKKKKKKKKKRRKILKKRIRPGKKMIAWKGASFRLFDSRRCRFLTGWPRIFRRQPDHPSWSILLVYRMERGCTFSSWPSRPTIRVRARTIPGRVMASEARRVCTRALAGRYRN